MKGIILSGGLSSRLYPATTVVNKQLLPVYDKPMIYYPLTTLMLTGIKDILIITGPQYSNSFKDLLGDGSQWGVKFSYEIQHEPKGIADAFLVGEKFINGDATTLILGDNIFWGHGFIDTIKSGCYEVMTGNNGAIVYGYWVNDPERFGVAEFDEHGKVLSIEEKPQQPKSNYAVIGLYCYDKNVVEYAKQVKPSARGELEITALNQIYLDKQSLTVRKLGRGVAWLDTGTHEAMAEASSFVEVIQKRQGLVIASPEEVAFRMGHIDKNQIKKLAEPMKKNHYGQYLLRLIEEE